MLATCYCCGRQELLQVEVSGLHDDSPAAWDVLEASADKLAKGHVVRDPDNARVFQCNQCFNRQRQSKKTGDDPKLLAYGIHEQCPKCTYDKLSIAWCAGWPSVSCRATIEPIFVEHLHLECGQCHYHWVTATADSGKST